jgi:F0F1-type ATP synthase membrane subunit b/b'
MDWTKLLFQIMNLAVMVLILYRLFFKSVLRALDKRSKSATSALDKVERQEREAAETYAQYQERLAQIKEAIASMRQESKEALWRTRKHVLAETRHEIETMQAKAEQRIKETHQREIFKYQCQLGRLVTTLSERLVSEAGGDLFQKACIEQFIEHLSVLQADEYHSADLAGEEQLVPVRLLSAYVLDEASIAQLEEQAQKMVGSPVRVTCQVDPALIAGATMYIGDMVIDGSVAGALHGLYERYVADLAQPPESARPQHRDIGLAA